MLVFARLQRLSSPVGTHSHSSIIIKTDQLSQRTRRLHPAPPSPGCKSLRVTPFSFTSTQNHHTFKMPKAAAPKRNGKKRAKKDPNAPKRGLSAYMFFANEQRENVRDENPGISFGQVGKLLGERWKALNDKQRGPYEAKAAADKKRYEDEKQAYNAEDESS
ncbi:hypothetical protein G6O67_007038 [Ophiocordyceps sinensis]|uniref:Non-histone chromosomal protein 6 n=2 Tax=Ophiocordyceps sinensis TaxID=72228 RepID=A0A8H4PLE2_9HYPO|nr:hypothetical protein G6O67_007038 [Ophiocordyceps sinensis]